VRHVACRDHFNCHCPMEVDSIGKHIFIELSSVCNLKCEFCAYSWTQRKGTFMSLELLGKILSDLKKIEPVDYVMFSALGEPTLHPSFEEACRMVRRKGYHLIVTTNGGRLRESMRALPINELFISFNTPTETSYALKRGKGPEYQDYVHNLKEFIQSVPLYDTYLYFLTENKRDYPHAHGFVDRASRESADRLEDLLRQFRPGVRLDLPIPERIELYSNVYAVLKPLTSWVNTNLPPELELREAENIRGDSCSYYKHQLNILATGEVTLCCGDHDGALKLGNVRSESLREIYLRKRPDINLAENELCRKCKGCVSARPGDGA
jgi:MoaA/NifB/PqqE/SkfB family radical SAM enzyme